ncbi:AraC family transcriptional regulator [Hoyosella sp. G463]|uniref:AraC family transcriptional regulator n=1 Tax=Lolliginicoccus lacisalsi TaxID=2742202 RepID=A0A927JEG4_9ACTN|nr:AraC family transcriptional regulator [Lolliginicoccus lacisalsi]MBD8507107.1 AraC family transcriptional regulator [Lolliginicoccus lacisalsi]
MVISGQAPVRAIRYSPSSDTARHGVEVMTLRSLRERMGPGEFTAPQCPRFHLIALVTEGHGTHAVDFRSGELHPGTVWWVRPGQVQQWGNVYDYEATIVLLEDGVLGPIARSSLTGSPMRWRCCWHLDENQSGSNLVAPLIAHLSTVFDQSGPGAAPLLRHLANTLLITLLDIAPPDPGPAPTIGSSTVDTFAQAVEDGFTRTRSVSDYARELGYSEKTVTRAVRAATGLTAKQFIDERVILECKRLLSHTERTTGSIADDLGFSDVSNFTKFFAARTGMSPTEFRRSARPPRW